MAAVLVRVTIGSAAELLPEKSRGGIPVQISGVFYQSLGLESGEFVHLRSRVEVRFDTGATVYGEVRLCSPRADRFYIRLNLFDAQVEPQRGLTRADPRHLVNILATARVPTQAGAIYAATILDVSRSGLRLRCPRSFEPGTKIEISCERAHIFGIVRYSRDVTQNEFHLGIEIDAGSRVFGQTGDLDLTGLYGRD